MGPSSPKGIQKPEGTSAWAAEHGVNREVRMGDLTDDILLAEMGKDTKSHSP